MRRTIGIWKAKSDFTRIRTRRTIGYSLAELLSYITL
jgi:hypothetical protein